MAPANHPQCMLLAPPLPRLRYDTFISGTECTSPLQVLAS
jgi:hypothetical protein